MNIPPQSPTAADVLGCVQQRWDPTVTRAEYLPVGFGAHHWRIGRESNPVLFATLDQPSTSRPAPTFERAYMSAAALTASGFQGAVAPMVNTQGTYTITLGDGILSVTPWIDGRTPTFAESSAPAHAARMVKLLSDLHQSPIPALLPAWQPPLDPAFAVALKSRLALSWLDGPFGNSARDVALASIGQIEDMAMRYADLAERALAAKPSWVPTHGEPHFANQMIVDGRLVLIDWESFALAPAERDMLDLNPKYRSQLGSDPDMLELFRLEWRLAEIDEYTRRFQEPHTGDEDDVLALEKLRREIAGE